MRVRISWSRRSVCGPGSRKQSSKEVSRSATKVPGGTVMHRSSEIPTSTLPPGGRLESAAALSLHSRGEDRGCHPTAHSAGVDI